MKIKNSLIIGFIALFISFTFLVGGLLVVGAQADCRPAQTLTNTDYTRMLEATDDFIETNYLQANVAWSVAGNVHPSPKELKATLNVGPASTINTPGEVDPNRSKIYDLVLSRECAADKWTVTSFTRVKNP